MIARVQPEVVGAVGCKSMEKTCLLKLGERTSTTGMIYTGSADHRGLAAEARLQRPLLAAYNKLKHPIAVDVISNDDHPRSVAILAAISRSSTPCSFLTYFPPRIPQPSERGCAHDGHYSFSHLLCF